MSEHLLTTYIRTKIVFNYRLKDLKSYDKVKIYLYELKKLNCHNEKLLEHLRRRGEIDYDEKRKEFWVLKNGPIDLKLLQRTKRLAKQRMPLTPLHLYMREQLKHVTITLPLKDISVYFRAFLEHRSNDLDSFFTVDSFSNRVHTPVVNLKHDQRMALRLYGKKLMSLDVKQMQPTILAKILLKGIGRNSFSDAIFKGQDVYVMLQERAGLATRPEAKKLLFQVIFGRPNNTTAQVFTTEEDRKWMNWITEYKSKTEPKNPHHKDCHTNLAWLLQYSEVQVMTDIWRRLMEDKIPFLSIHDDVLCIRKDGSRVRAIMEEELRGHFEYFELNIE